MIPLLEQVAALKHDLGKYSSWLSANLDEEAWEGPVSEGLVDALRRDLLATRTGPGGDAESAWAVWERLSGEVPRPWPDELGEVADAVAALRSAEAPLRRGDRDAIGPLRPAIRDAQRTIRAALLRLHRRLLRGEDP